MIVEFFRYGELLTSGYPVRTANEAWRLGELIGAGFLRITHDSGNVTRYVWAAGAFHNTSIDYVKTTIEEV